MPPPPPRSLIFRLRSRRRGAALVICLGFLVVLTILTVAFFSTVEVEGQASRREVEAVALDSGAALAINLVKNQITAATRESDTLWVSQPGLLRTFAIDGTASRAYKLYSAPVLSADGGAPAPEWPEDWNTRPNEWVDLNEPFVRDDAVVYPIADPTAVGLVDGFSLEDNTLEAAMPLQWLYQLADGSLGTLADVTAENPALCRIAFWSDDESGKVNLNTAGEGVWWNLPRSDAPNVANAEPELMELSRKQPVQREYQRYPGHPATTSLSPILGRTLGLPANLGTMTPTQARAERHRFNEALLALLPRIMPGGSEGGTREIDSTAGALPLRRDRLLKTPNEFLFTPRYDANDQRIRLPSDLLVSDPSAGAPLPARNLERLGFFLTAHNRSPDFNAFKLPRVTLWPLHRQTGSDYRTPFDQLIAEASRLGSHSYAFVREEAASPTADFAGETNRNRQLRDYLLRLLERNWPGYGGKFSDKYPADYTQTLTQIIDYARTINLADTSTTPAIAHPFTPTVQTAANGDALNTPGHGQVAPLRIGDTRGFGRFPSLGRISLLFIEERAAPPQPNDPPERFMRAVLLLELFMPQSGYTPYYPDFDLTVNATVAPKVSFWEADGTPISENHPLAFHNATKTIRTPPGMIQANSGVDGPMGYWCTFLDIPVGEGEKQGKAAAYPWYTEPVALPPLELRSAAEIGTSPEPATDPFDMTRPLPHFRLDEAEFQLVFASGGETVQTLNLRFPVSGRLPIPFRGHCPPIFQQTETRYAPATLAQRISGRYTEPKGTTNNPGFIWPLGDALLQLDLDPDGPSGGDLRLLAARRTLSATESAAWYAGCGYDDRSVVAYTSDAPALTDEQANNQLLGDFSIDVAKPGHARGWRFRGVVMAVTTRGNADHNWSPYEYRNTANGLILGAIGANQTGTQGSRQSGGQVIPNGRSDWRCYVPREMRLALNREGGAGDFDTAQSSKGPFINKPDDGIGTNSADPDHYPYLFHPSTRAPSTRPGETFSSPARQVPSPGILGSLPTGVVSARPWQTLLFSPVPSARFGVPADSTGKGRPQIPTPAIAAVPHVGEAGRKVSASGAATTEAGIPPDHVILDLFHMPVVEPYAISEPFSTAGRVNLNYQIRPFTHIRRASALHAALHPLLIQARGDGAMTNKVSYLHEVDIAATLDNRGTDTTPNPWWRDFEVRFRAGDLFLLPGEICEVPLIPKPARSPDLLPALGTGFAANSTYNGNLSAFWLANRFTGDNQREEPYTSLYPRVTTRSNTFTVHYRVQALSPAFSRNPAARDNPAMITGERRGSRTLERYIDLDTVSTDFATATGSETVEDHYRFREISGQSF